MVVLHAVVVGRFEGEKVEEGHSAQEQTQRDPADGLVDVLVLIEHVDQGEDQGPDEGEEVDE